MRPLALVVLGASALVAAPPARAVTVTADDDRVVVADARDQRNSLRVTVGTAAVTIEDFREHRVTAGHGCFPRGRHAVRCPLADGIEVRAGGADDRLDLVVRPHGPHPDVTLDGGPGDDYLSGSEGRQVLFGRAGNDRLRGSFGLDRIHGGPGDDTLDAGTGSLTVTGWPDKARDHLSCGGGRDRVHDPGQDPIPLGCQRLSASGAILDYEAIDAHPQPAGPRKVLVEAVCVGWARTCAFRARILHRGVEIGRSAVTRFPPGHRKLAVRLERPLPGSGGLRIVVEGDELDADGASSYRFTWVVRARPPASSR